MFFIWKSARRVFGMVVFCQKCNISFGVILRVFFAVVGEVVSLCMLIKIYNLEGLGGPSRFFVLVNT